MTPLRQDLTPLLWVFLAGGVGATLRVVLGGLVDVRLSSRLPHAGTLVVNMLGCLAIGVAAVALPAGVGPLERERYAVTGGYVVGRRDGAIAVIQLIATCAGERPISAAT
mgnify:CR=1 FL=1